MRTSSRKAEIDKGCLVFALFGEYLDKVVVERKGAGKMGLDLTLLPFDSERFSHTVLTCERSIDLFEEIGKLQAVRVPTEFNTFVAQDDEHGDHYGNTQDTPYGEPLTFVLVEQLLPFSKYEEVTDNFKNRAIWAYLKQLPRDTKVALYWS